jgi:uncharacterized protein (DUF1697 family)
VGKHNRIKMAELRELMEGIGLSEVKTHIQSGNVVFEDRRDEEAIALSIEACLKDTLGVPVAAMVRSGDDLATLVALDPFAGKEGGIVTFLRHKPDGLPPEASPKGDLTEIRLVGRDMLSVVHHQPGQPANPALIAEKGLKVLSTTRNWGVVVAVNDLLHS